MKKLNPYLHFDGNAEEAMNFYKSVFGGEFQGGIMRMKDAPGTENFSDEDKNRVMHIALPIGPDGSVLMASDTPPAAMGLKLIVGNNVDIALSPDSKEEADKIFAGLSAGGKVEMSMEQTFFGYFGSCVDKFGINWMINYEENQA
jgi:Uncharacterized protein conserved in bacteria